MLKASQEIQLKEYKGGVFKENENNIHFPQNGDPPIVEEADIKQVNRSLSLRDSQASNTIQTRDGSRNYRISTTLNTILIKGQGSEALRPYILQFAIGIHAVYLSM